MDQNYDLTGATYDATSNRIFLTANNLSGGTSIVAINAATGVQTGITTAPYNIQSWSGLAIQPSNGHLWLGAVNGGSTLVEYQIGAGGALTQLRTLDISAQGVNQNEISGLSFDAAGNLWVSSTQGEIYKVILP
jgi:ligand-binding sensor domain-containing protein